MLLLYLRHPTNCENSQNSGDVGPGCVQGIYTEAQVCLSTKNFIKETHSNDRDCFLSHWIIIFFFSKLICRPCFCHVLGDCFEQFLLHFSFALNRFISSKRIYNSTTFHWIAGCLAYFSMTINDDKDDDDADVRMPIKMHWELQSVCHIANYQICIRSKIQNNQHSKVTWKE